MSLALCIHFQQKVKFLLQLPGSFFHKTLKTSIFRLVSMWHRVAYNSTTLAPRNLNNIPVSET